MSTSPNPSTAASAWLQGTNATAAAVSRARTLALLALAAFAIGITLLVPMGIGASWRECDTQTIARNFILDDFDPMRPRVDWRGDTDGAVECEFPLYQLLVACTLRLVGLVEWPGRVLSLGFTLLAAWALYLLLERRSGPAGALPGMLVFLATGTAPLLAARVVPDALSLAFALLSLLAFVRYLQNGRLAPLSMAVAAATIAALQKPLALQIGLVMFGWTIATAPQRLRDARLWLGFMLIPAIVAAWLVHAAALHQETGLTFGVVSGGDTKFPDLPHLFDLATYGSLLATTLQYGFPVLAMIALLSLVLRRRLDRTDGTLLFAVAAGLMVSLRYSCTVTLGPHYHAFAAAAGAWFVARAWPAHASRWLWLGLLLGVALQGGWRVRFERGLRIVVNRQPIVVAAQAIAPLLRNEDLLLVRSELPRLDHEWHRANNFEDPRFFFLTEQRGFVVAADEWDIATIEDRHRRGADIVFDPLPEQTSAAISDWLDRHGQRLYDGPQARVHRLLPRSIDSR